MSESNGYLSPFIGDGYDRTATIGEIEGLWSKVRIRYRPAAAHEVSNTYKQAEINPTDAPIKYHAKLMAEKIINWDIRNGNHKVPVTAENIERLNYGFYNILRAVVYAEAAAKDDETGEEHPKAGDDAKN